ncbi:sulfurtransferase TusA family protein [Selenomonas caprae]|jgi:TusA-related sulfurtransferase|uniref:Sulfurtransferase TusA family protein n=3 Tax=Selenomonas TaxID=970 RepID=A0A5D6W4K0_9FIRM|nr:MULTISPECIES: sulfurtransferase TusA family protein [Selenomonas]MBE6074083.1 sulfurtransferase TusA family protein [Selenomonas ruminantium]MBQ1867972.1 sulfurtransferase TusA family protein [Selenomonas sp.]TYZ23361.1 sulfurtransferase TusA family protein [Selenomonas sp. mPRGC5]TYZ27479.1 sulfurtransferase TusA family protein [Selenomonas caprae]SDG33184.1 TusA-related sulfurtransferase [Selenomonas ruminantium]
MSEAWKIDDTIDITDVVCPITFVKVKMALEDLDDGQILGVHLNEGEPIQNVPRSLKDEGHKVLSVSQAADGTYDLVVQKGGREL